MLQNSIRQHLIALLVAGAAFAATARADHEEGLGGYVRSDLVSDGAVPAVNTDPNLKNPWGIAAIPGAPFRISDNGTGVSTLYDGKGDVIPLVVRISAPPEEQTDCDESYTMDAYNGCMYLPEKFREMRTPVLHALMRTYPLATLVVNTPGGMLANHVPLEIAAGGEFGVLRGHIARANPLWKQSEAGAEALAIFQGPEGYISPNFYPSKLQSGEVVPTWNYAVVHARGAISFTQDAPWLRDLVGRLTDAHEAASEQPWKVDDAPVAFTDTQLRFIVGLEVPINSLIGKFKLSQNRTETDRDGVRRGLEARGDDQALGMLRMLEP